MHMTGNKKGGSPRWITWRHMGFEIHEFCYLCKPAFVQGINTWSASV